jgi:hypothetical protein
MRLLVPTLALLLTATPALAQSVFDRAVGSYGLPDDPAASCAANPHRLDFTGQPPHAFLTWEKPARTAQGEWTDRARFDIVNYTDTTIALMLEGDPNRTDTGERIIWLLRLTDQPAGYCWGRADWPSVRCVAPAVRCDETAPTS